MEETVNDNIYIDPTDLTISFIHNYPRYSQLSALFTTIPERPGRWEHSQLGLFLTQGRDGQLGL